MPSIDYKSEQFPNKYAANMSQSLAVTWGDVLWSALTIGRPSIHHVFRHGESSYYEAIFRLSLVRLALEQSDKFNGPFQKTQAFKNLDPTEKGSISYFLGMTICKLFSSKLLNTNWLLHLDVFASQLNPTIKIGRSRPDLVGLESYSQYWHAFECKGRSSEPDSEVKRKAKQQADRLVSVNSSKCRLHIGSISYFKKDMLHYFWRDPEPEGEDKLDPIKLNLPKDAWKNYYCYIISLFIEAKNKERVENQGNSAIAYIDEADIKISIYQEVLDFLLDEDWLGAHEKAAKSAVAEKLIGFWPDGLLVEAGPSWDKALIFDEP